MLAKAASPYLRKRGGPILCFFLFLLPLSPVHAEKPTLFMAGVEMKLGMPKDILLGKLKEHYKLSEVDENNWIIFEGKEPSSKTIGSVGFSAGRLSWISRDWGSFSDNGSVGLAKELFSLFSNLSSGGPTPVIMHPKTVVRQPGLTVNQIELFIGETRVLITVSETLDRGSSVTVQEIVESQP